MLEINDKQQGIIIKHYDKQGWCIRGWSRITSGKNAGGKRKSQSIIINKDIIDSIKAAMMDLIDNRKQKVVIRYKGMVLVIDNDYMTLIARGQGFHNIYNKRYTVALNKDKATLIISQLNKIK